VRGAVGGEDRAAASVVLAAGHERIGATAHHHLGPGPRCHPVVAEHRGPRSGDAGQHRVPGHDGHGDDPRRGLDPVVHVGDQHRRCVLDRRAVVPRLALDAGERQVAPDHQQTAAGPDVALDRGEPVRGGLRVLERLRGEQDAVGADVGKDHRRVTGQVARGRRKLGRHQVPGQVVDLDAAAGEHRAKLVGALDVGTRRERVHALDVQAVGDPALAAEQHAHDGDLASRVGSQVGFSGGLRWLAEPRTP
jgi:hypothetical protein